MKGTKILALLCGMIMLGNQMPVIVGPAYAIESEAEVKMQVTLDNNFADIVTIKEKVYNRQNDAEADFSNVKLNGAAPDAVLSLTGKAMFTDVNAGDDKEVVISDIKLTGDDEDKYTLENSEEIVRVRASVKPKTIHVKPVGSFVAGEVLPKSIPYVFDENEIINGDSVNISAKLNVVYSDEKGYEYQIDDCKATGNNNYILELDENCVPVPVEPGTIDAPVITTSSISKDKATVLKQFDYGIASDGSVKVTVEAKTRFNTPVTFSLTDNKGKKMSETIEELSYDEGNVIYTAQATFIIDTDKNKNEKDISLSCEVESGGSSSKVQPLELKLDDNTNKVSRIIIDKTGPEIKTKEAHNYGMDKCFFDAKGSFCDSETGIDKIYYIWDSDINGEESWKEYNGDFSHSPGETVVFYEKAEWSNSANVLSRRIDGSHLLDIKIVNNIGIETVDRGWKTNGIDTQPPEVSYIELTKGEESTWDKILNMLSFGTYVKEKIRVDVVAEDKSNGNKTAISGIKSVELTDGNNVDSKVLLTLEKLEDEDDTYTTYVKPQLRIDSWYVRVTDNNQNKGYYSVKDLLIEQYDEEEDEVEWNCLNNDKWVFDSEPPTIKIDYNGAVNKNGTVYFTNKQNKGNDRKGIHYTAVDEMGLYRFRIKQYQYSDDDSYGTGSTWYVLAPNEIHDETLKSEKTFETESLETGWYKYVAKAEDCAGNTIEETIKVYIDNDKPEGTFSLESGSYVEVTENESWVSEKDRKGKYQSLSFKVRPVQKGSEIETVKVKVEGKDNYVREYIIPADKFKEDEDGLYAEVKISLDPISKDYLAYPDNHTYKLDAVVVAVSGNESDDMNYILHVDTDEPEVENVIVEKEGSALSSVLNVLSFGVFSNDSIKLAVKVRDGANDIGISKVMISYDGLDEPVQMKKDQKEKGVYYHIINKGTDIFKSEISITVYDKLKKVSIDTPDINNVTGDRKTSENSFVMLEDISPSLTVKLPQADRSDNKDGKIWYRKHINSESDTEKCIELIAEDEDSGIQQINMTINGKCIDHSYGGIIGSEIISGIERNGLLLPSTGSIDGLSYKNRTNLCEKFKFSYSIEKIAENIKPNEDGSYVMTFEVIDNAGNITTVPIDGKKEYDDSKVIFYRDEFSPVVEKFIFDPASVDNISTAGSESFIEELEYGYFFKEPFDLKLIVNDPFFSSGLESASFRLIPFENGKAKEESIIDNVPIVNSEAKITVPAGFKGQIYGKACDKVNNVSNECTPKGYVVDETQPVITIEPLSDNFTGKDMDGNNIYTEKVDFKVTVSDTQSGLRCVKYSKESELDSFNEVIIDFSSYTGIIENDTIGNDWKITRKDTNLITEVSKVFTFDKDDNDIILTFSAVDRSGNETKQQQSSKFTIDTIAPEISISRVSDVINDQYFNGEARFNISVIERNFSSEKISSTIRNSFTGNVPVIRFDNVSGHVHTAEVVFPEGDYSFSISGSDLGGNTANIKYNGEDVGDFFNTSFNVDTTKPMVQTNFSVFGRNEDEGIYFNKDQTAEIIVTEHNFYDADMGITVQSKMPGASHADTIGEWIDIGYISDWNDEGDKHTLKIGFNNDGIYRIIMNPKDRAGNDGEYVSGSSNHTAIFEIDKTNPKLHTRNDIPVTEDGFVVTPFCDVYDEKRKDEAPPSIEFDDVNFARIEIQSVIYTPTYENGKEMGEVEISPLSAELSKPVEDKKFILPNFDHDGVYTFTYVAVDKAGNRSETISDTYFRMVDTDVLAYIYNSRIGEKNSNDASLKPTGYYSLMSSEGKAISKKATDFDDLDILVIKPIADQQAGKLVLREDEKKYFPEEYNAFITETEDISETATMVKMHLPGEYFSESFRDDGLDTRMYLSVSIRDDVFLDLASVRIDNEAPTAFLPVEFKNWHNYFFESEKTITIKDISEVLDDKLSKVYECSRNGSRVEIPHEYDIQSGTLSFKLDKGVHHIDITLADEAGNEWNVDRVKYLRVGNFRLYIIGICTLLLVSALIILILRKSRRNW